MRGRDPQSRTGSTSTRSWRHRQETESILDFPGAKNLPQPERRCSSSTATSWSRRRSRTRSPARTRRASRPRSSPRRPTARRPRTASEILRQARRAGHPRHLPQRRRRHGLLLRVAQEPLAHALRPHGAALRGAHQPLAPGARPEDRPARASARTRSTAPPTAPTRKTSSTPASRTSMISAYQQIRDIKLKHGAEVRPAHRRLHLRDRQDRQVLPGPGHLPVAAPPAIYGRSSSSSPKWCPISCTTVSRISRRSSRRDWQWSRSGRR